MVQFVQKKVLQNFSLDAWLINCFIYLIRAHQFCQTYFDKWASKKDGSVYPVSLSVGSCSTASTLKMTALKRLRKEGDKKLVKQVFRSFYTITLFVVAVC